MNTLIHWAVNQQSECGLCQNHCSAGLNLHEVTIGQGGLKGNTMNAPDMDWKHHTAGSIITEINKHI